MEAVEPIPDKISFALEKALWPCWAVAEVILVLVAEDSEDDRWFLRRAFQQVSILKLIAEVEDGEQAIDYLSGRGPYADRGKYPLPQLLLSDLKMPKVGG